MAASHSKGLKQGEEEVMHILFCGMVTIITLFTDENASMHLPTLDVVLFHTCAGVAANGLHVTSAMSSQSWLSSPHLIEFWNF